MSERQKPQKPYPTFPLTPHNSGTWCKKVRGRLFHFGPWSDPLGARDRWEEQAKTLRAGAAPPSAADRTSARAMLNRWLAEKLKDAESGNNTWGHYTQCRRLVRLFLSNVPADARLSDLNPDTFSEFGRVLERRYGGRTLRKAVRVLSGAFRYMEDEDWIATPVKLGKRFKGLARRRDPDPPMDKARTPADLRKIIAAAEAHVAHLEGAAERNAAPARQLLAAVWLGINGGYGSADLAELPKAVVDLDGLDGPVIDYRRGKTGQERIVPLMPETVAALRPVLAQRPEDPLVFRTAEGQPWKREQPVKDDFGQVVRTTTIDNFQQAYGKLLRRAKMKVPGAGFYELKHSHSELADAAGDVHAAMRLVGHALPASRDPYVRVTMERLKKVVESIRSHLVNPEKGRRSGRGSGKSKHGAGGVSRPGPAAPPSPASRSRRGGSGKRR